MTRRFPHLKLICLLILAALAASGCRRFSGRNADFEVRGPAKVAPGEAAEVRFKVVRNWNDDEVFKLEFDAPRDVIITPAVVEFKAGRVVTAGVTVEVSRFAEPGERVIKFKTTPEVQWMGPYEWRFQVDK